MSHNSIIYNDLGNYEVGVWTNLNPEIDPGRWAQRIRMNTRRRTCFLCRLRLGGAS